MSPIKKSSREHQKKASIGRSGIGFSQTFVEKIGWKRGQHKVEISFILNAKCILVSKPTQSNDAFLVSYGNKRKLSGAKINCLALVRNYLQALVTLPIKTIPVIINHKHWQVALILDEINWITEEFSKSGNDNLTKNLQGVYQLLGKNKTILKIGEGLVKDRIRSYLSEPLRFSPQVKEFRYIYFEDKEDCELMEKILLAQFEAETGVLPHLNDIRA